MGNSGLAIGDGLHIGLEEFRALPQKEQIATIYKNSIKQLQEFEKLEGIIGGYKINQRIQYGWLLGLTGGVVWIITKANIIPALFAYILAVI